MELMMSLSAATLLDGTPVNLPGEAPFPAAALEPFIGVPFFLPCEDPWIVDGGTEDHVYLDSVRDDWAEFSDYLDVLNPDSPCYEIKRAARDLYLHTWRDHIHAGRVLDVGCGVGRMSMPFLDRGAEVIGVDADMQSLYRYAWHAAGRAGRLDLHWSSAHRLPALGDFDLAIACEVLCYVRDIDTALMAIAERLRPGGALLISVEGRWGWAAAVDATADSIDAALEQGSELDVQAGIVHVPGRRWVRTYEGDELSAALSAAGLEVKSVTPLLYTYEGPLESCLPEDPDLDELVEFEERCRVHPIWQRLNRVWTAVAVKP
jgi:2-polyprenyl-3-methyl-5-hydroxy-6-metoxy-1,4-benzoquinol methylase